MNKTIKILLTQDLYSIIDLDDFEKVKLYKWFAHKNKNSVYVETNMIKNGKYTTVKLHRFLMNCPFDKIIDHIDGNGLNNCKSNLRICNHSQNNMNKRIPITNTSGFKGVSYYKKTNNWTSQLMIKKKTLYFGRFIEPEEAYLVYLLACIFYFGEFTNSGE